MGNSDLKEATPHIKKAGINTLAAKLVDVVRKYLPGNPGHCDLDQTGDGCLPDEIDSVAND